MAEFFVIFAYINLKYMQEKKFLFYTLENPEKPGIIRYVGVTTTTLNQRFYHHKYTSKKRRNSPVSKWIHSLLSLGVVPEIKLLDECLEDNWEIMERYWISQLKSWGFNLLNIQEGGSGVVTKEQRNNDGIERSRQAHCKKVLQLDEFKNILNTFNSSAEATLFHNFNSKGTLSNVLCGNSTAVRAAGFYWCFEKDYENFVIPPTFSAADTWGIKIYQYNTKFEFIQTFKCIDDVKGTFLKNRDSNSSSLINAIKSKILWKDYFWSYCLITDFEKYFDNTYKVLELDLNENIVQSFKSLTEVAKCYHLKPCTISNRIKNKTMSKDNTFFIHNKK